MTIAQRLYVLILVTTVGLLGISGLGIYQMNRVYNETNYTNLNTIPSLNDLNTAFRGYTSSRVMLWHYMSIAPEQREALAKQIAAADEAMLGGVKKYESSDVADAKDRALLAGLKEAVTTYSTIRQQVLQMADEARLSEAQDLIKDSQPKFNKVDQAFTAQRDYNAEIGRQNALQAQSTMHQSTWIIVAIAALVIAFVAGIGLLLTRRLVGSLNEAVGIARTVASGDLTRDIVVASTDETGQLLQALKDMSGSLVNIVGQVRAGTDTIATASGEIAAGNMDLSGRTEQQASSLEETASSMEELTSTVKQNADNARHANQLAAQATATAQRCGEVSARVNTTMESISTSAKKIVDIISVIDGIAFQTNILALNAAVEAARAGEQGRGFAVVASEVRNLAQRSASAAKEIKQLIGDSVDKVNAGTQLVSESGKTMDEVVASVRQVSDIIVEITAASMEQSSGLDQINQAVAQMDQVTQQNASLVEEAAAAAASLQEQAAGLSDVVGFFRIPGGRQARPVQQSQPLRLVA
jgi:methyl-accepting chemotaxis protein